MNKYKKLLKNSLIFAVGNLGSKLLSILLLPLYTSYLSTSDFGTIDIIITMTNLLYPIISLSIYDAVLRFALDKKYDDAILSNGLIVTVIGIFLSFFLLIYHTDYIEYLTSIIILQSLQSLFASYARGIGRVKLFVINGLLYTFVASICTFLFLVFFNMKLEGYFYSIIIALVFSTFFLFVAMHLERKVTLKKINWTILKEMLIYSIPLIPNSFVWWLNNASSKFFILFFLGVSTNGLFALANKIPALITMLNTIFFQSWQLSAVEEYNSKQTSIFYTNIFFNYIQMVFLANACILAILKLVIYHFVSENFYSAWIYIPPLLVGNIYASFSSFLGTTYIAAKKTKGVLMTTFIGAILNIIFNFLFIPFLGGIGAGVASAISFLTIWLIRQRDTQKFVHIKINMYNLVLNHILMFTQMLVVYQTKGIMSFIGHVICITLIININKYFIKNIYYIFNIRTDVLSKRE